MNGIPGPWTPLDADVIVQGFQTDPGPGPGPGPIDPTPPTPVDPKVAEVAAITKAKGLSEKESLAVASLIQSLKQMNVSDSDFGTALDKSLGIIDPAMGAGGKIVAWGKEVSKVTTNPDTILAGLTAVYSSLPDASIVVANAAMNRVQLPAESQSVMAERLGFDVTAIIAIIQMVIQLLQQLGWI